MPLSLQVMLFFFISDEWFFIVEVTNQLLFMHNTYNEIKIWAHDKWLLIKCHFSYFSQRHDEDFFFCVLIWHIKFFAPHHTKRTPTLIAAIYSNCFNFYFTLICNFYALTFFLFIKFTREKRARTFPRNFINDSTGKKIGNFEATFYSSDWWEVIFFAFASFFDLPKTLTFYWNGYLHRPALLFSSSTDK